jgi:integrase/recombinase XerD
MIVVLCSRVTGPLEPYALGFAVELTRLGYTAHSATGQVGVVAHLSRWMASERLVVEDLVEPVVERYMAVRRAAGYTNYRTAKALVPLLGYLRGLGAAPPPSAPAVLTPVEELLARYHRYLIVERGLGGPTAHGYLDAVRPFLAGRAGQEGGLELAGLTAADVTAFVLAACPGRAIGPAKLTVTALRSLLRFLHVDGVLPVPLGEAVPSVAGWRLSGLPRALEAEQVDRLLEACDRHHAAGRRDLAIQLLLVRLGLRAGEVAALILDDIDWRAGELTVRGKGNRAERLPLPVDVGEAIADYLRDGRPATAAGRTVFVRLKAPHQQLTSGGITQVVFAAGQRAGLGKLHAHRLRHTAATAMLRAGAPLAEVGQVLRHRRALSTAIYAKVDRQALAVLARPWPGTLS